MPGISVGVSDEPADFKLYLHRNPRSNFLTECDGKIVATALGAHDGRRGMIRHVAVSSEYRGYGLARTLTDQCIAALLAEGI